MSLQQDLEKRVTGLVMEGVDVIFVKERYLMERIMRAKLPPMKKQIPIILVQSLDDIKAFSHVQMRELGWVRSEKMSEEDAIKVLQDKGYDVDMEKK